MPEKQHSTTDTICALATPPGVAGLAVIRISGPNALATCDMFFRGATMVSESEGHRIHYGWWVLNEAKVDTVTVSVFRLPNSYTGEDIVEVGCHGGVFVTEQILVGLRTVGLRLAEPGEFTRRAFLNRKLDLTQVEAVADIIHAESRHGAQIAARQLSGGFTKHLRVLREQLLDVIALLELELDFSEEDVEFVDRSALKETVSKIIKDVEATASSAHSAEVLRSGFHVAVVGYPNAGKSSLFNALLQRNRAIVSDEPGTTRDYLTETIFVDGYSVHLADTAGLRDTQDVVELQGIALTRSLIEQSDLVLVVNDLQAGAHHSNALLEAIEVAFAGTPVVLVQNKVDMVATKHPNRHVVLYCSATHGTGIDALRELFGEYIRASTTGITDVLVNARQALLLGSIGAVMRSALIGMDEGLTCDIFAVDIRSAIRLLGDITGEGWNPDVLDNVFSRFCIGK